MARQFAYDSTPVIETRQGKLRGYQLDGIYIFKGIHYAEAGRFQMPVPPKAWDGVQEAASYGFVCPMLTQDTPKGELMVPHRYWPQDEHCQNLNIWTPAIGAQQKKPVLVWLHGGGFSMGSSIEQKVYNGENMARYGDAVVVSVNHRLNILGYLDLSPYGKKYKNTGNLGQADLVAALQWVHENIAAFGGDPENVTIFGQSGGGMKVSGLMQTPAADGLFHRGIIMSGVAGDLLAYSSADSRPLIRAMLTELGLTETQVEKLETIPYPTLAAAYNKVSPAIARAGGYIGCTPRANDYFLGEGPAAGFTAHAAKIPVMIGSVFGEFAFMPLPAFKDEAAPEAVDDILTQRFGPQADALKAEFAAAYPGKHPLDLLNLDLIFRVPTKRFIESFAQAGGKTYSYLFALEFPYQHGKIAWHCADIPFVFHNTELAPVSNIPDVSDRLESQIFDAVMQFARAGDPSHPGLPAWPVSVPGDEATMIFDRECEVRHNFDDKLLQMYLDASPQFDPAAVMDALSDNNIQH